MPRGGGVAASAAVGSGEEVFAWRGGKVTATEHTSFTLCNCQRLRGATSGRAVYQLLFAAVGLMHRGSFGKFWA